MEEDIRNQILAKAKDYIQMCLAHLQEFCAEFLPFQDDRAFFVATEKHDRTLLVGEVEVDGKIYYVFA